MSDAALLFERYALVVFRYFRIMTGRPDLAEDLTQDVFLHIVRHVGKYAEQGREREWVLKIAYRVLLDNRRGQGQGSLTVSLDDVEAPAVGSKQVIALGVAQALRQLPAGQRQLLLLRELGGLSHSELAAMLGITPSAVRGRLYRAKETVRVMLPGRAATWTNERD